MVEAPVTNKRVVSALMATYFAVEDDVAGNPVQIVRTANRGDTIDLVEREEKRLDAVDALAPPGRTPEQTEEEAQARMDVYRAERGDKTAVERAMARAIAPSPPPQDIPDPPPTVSPPGGGAEPRGTYTMGDRGAPDVQPRNVRPPAGGIVRADAPDVAAATPAEIALWLTEARPNAGDTVALAEGDPVLAAKVLEAEQLATKGDPRASVQKPLNAITGA